MSDEGPAFAIDGELFPGTAKVAEEAGEFLQIFGKLLATGGKRHHWDGQDLQDRLLEELADLSAALDFTVRHGAEIGWLNLMKFDERREYKIQLFEEWRGEMPDLPEPERPCLLSRTGMGEDIVCIACGRRFAEGERIECRVKKLEQKNVS